MKKDLSRFLQSRFNMFLYTMFGWHVTRVLVFCFGALYYFLHRNEKERITLAVLEGVGPERRKGDIPKVIKRVFKGIYSHYYEKLFIAYEKPEKAIRFLNKHISDDDLFKLRLALKKGTGVLLVTGHYGAIEFIPTLLAAKGFDVSMIAKFKTPQLKRKVYAQAKRYGIRLIDGTKEGGILKSAGRELRENRVLITQCDEIEEWRPSPKQTLSFLGRLTGLDRTINVIQKRTGAQVVFSVIHRHHLSKYELRVVDVAQMKSQLNRSNDISTGEALLKFLERSIYTNPEQWYQWKKYFSIGDKEDEIMIGTESGMRRPSILYPFFGKAPRTIFEQSPLAWKSKQAA